VEGRLLAYERYVHSDGGEATSIDGAGALHTAFRCQSMEVLIRMGLVRWQRRREPGSE